MSWRNIGRSIAESSLVAAMSIVYFVGMEDKHLPWQRMSHQPAIVERLHTDHRQSDSVGIVPMR
jgi:hypothetical protein